MVSWSEMPRSPGHVFYDRLQSVLIEGGFDGFAEDGEDLQTAWRERLAREGKLSGSAESVRDLILGQTTTKRH